MSLRHPVIKISKRDVCNLLFYKRSLKIGTLLQIRSIKIRQFVNLDDRVGDI